MKSRLKRRVRNSYLVSTVSMLLVLFLLGSVAYLLVVSMQVADTLQGSITATVELRKELSDEQKEAIKTTLTDEDLVSSIAYSSKEEKLQDAEFRQQMGDNFEEIAGENPLFDSYELTLTAQSADSTVVDNFIARAMKIKGVARIDFPAQVAGELHATVSKIRLVLLLFGAALLIVSLILLSNTIRLSILSKRYLINTMKLVGATKWFIMKPFLWSGITQGILAGIGASIIFVAALYGLTSAIPELLTMAALREIGIILGAMIVAGIVLSGLFTLFALDKFINLKSNKIYLY